MIKEALGAIVEEADDGMRYANMSNRRTRYMRARLTKSKCNDSNKTFEEDKYERSKEGQILPPREFCQSGIPSCTVLISGLSLILQSLDSEGGGGAVHTRTISR